MNPPVWQSLSELHLRPQFGGGPGGASPTSLTLYPVLHWSEKTSLPSLGEPSVSPIQKFPAV